MVVTWILYLRFHIELLTDKTFGKIKKRYKAVGVAGVFLYLILGAALPYLHQPKVSEEYKKEFANKGYDITKEAKKLEKIYLKLLKG